MPMMHKKKVFDIYHDDPFANEKKKNWGFFARRRMRKEREFKEVMRVEEAAADLKIRAMELATMETEEKLGWDVYELPARNRQRMIEENIARVQAEKAKAKAEKKAEKVQKEEGFTSHNGFVQEFSRHKNSPALVHSLEGHTGAVLSFKLSSDCQYVVSASEDGHLKLWDLTTCKCVRTYEGHTQAVRCCDVVASFTKESPMGARVASGSADNTVRIWDAIYATCLKTIRGHTNVVNSVAFTPDGHLLASGSADRSVRLWDAIEGHLVYVFHGHSAAVVSCAFSPTGKYLLTSSNYGERKIKLWYTDMPHMAQLQKVGFRVIWETTGVMRRITVKYEPKDGFFTDTHAAKAEIDAEDAADEAWALEHPDGLASGAAGDDEDDEAHKAAMAELELERAALELPDTSEQSGFSISVNSVDRFGRQSQVNSYYPGVELLVVLRGAEPFSQFFVAAYHKRSQFDAFDERSGARVGTFSQDTEDESPGTKLCLDNQAVSNRPPLLPVPSNELAFMWRAPSLTDRAFPGAPQLTGPLVVKATMARDPLTIAPNEEDPGMVQVSYTLAEVDPPKKGHLLTEISQKIDKEEKKYEADLVANHQLFIDFVRNRDVYSAGTMLSSRCRLIMDGREVEGQDAVMEVLEELMMQEDVAVVVKDAKALCNGATTNALDRDKSKDGAKDAKATKKKGSNQNDSDASSSSSSSDEDEAGLDGDRREPSDKALRKALVASAPPGPSDWSNGPVPLSLRARDFMAGRKLSPSSSKRTTNRNLLSFTGGSGVSSLPSLPSLMLRSGSNPEPQQSGLNGGQHKRHHRHRHHSKHSGEASTRRKGEKEGLSLRARAQREIQAMLVLRRQGYGASEEIRNEHLPSSGVSPLRYEPEGEPELVHGKCFGIGQAAYRMTLPRIYPDHAMGADEAAKNSKHAFRQRDALQAQDARRQARRKPLVLFPNEREELVEASMLALAQDDAQRKVAAMKRREPIIEGLPGFENIDQDLNTAMKVKNYVLGKKASFVLPAGATAFLKAPKKKKQLQSTEAPNLNAQSLFNREPTTSSSAEGDGEMSYDQTRRRNAYPTLPGFQEKGEGIEHEHAQEQADLELARSPGRGGLVRTFVVEGFNGQGEVEVAHHNTISEVAFSLDEKRVASASADGTVRLWDLLSGRLISTLEGHSEAVNCVAFSDEGQRLVSSGVDNYLIIWNVATGLPLRKLYGHDDQVNKVCFFNDSTGIVSCSGDLSIKVWYLTPQPPAAPPRPEVSKRTGFTMTVVWKLPPSFNEELTAFHLQRREGTRGDFGHDATTPGNECVKLVEGLLPATAYQFRVRAVNRMGVGAWSESSAAETTEVDVPDEVGRPEVVEITPHSIGIEWFAPTAVVAGTSISRFVIQLAGGGVSYQDNVREICPWAQSAANHRAFKTRRSSMTTREIAKALGENSNLNLEILLADKAKRAAFQVKQVTREREAKAAREKAEQRARWERGDFSDPKEEKRRRREAKAKRKEEHSTRKEERKRRSRASTPTNMVSAEEDGGALVVAGEGSGAEERGEGTRRSSSNSSNNRGSRSNCTALVPETSSKDTGTLTAGTLTAGAMVEAKKEDAAPKRSSTTTGNLVAHFYMYENLQPGKTYRLRVAGVSTIGQGKWSATTFSTTTLATPPAKPDAPQVHDIGLFGMRLEWVAPDEHGSSIASYKVRNNFDNTEHALSANEVTLVLRDLNPGECYTFQLCAANQQGWGPWSEESDDAWTLTSIPEVPDPPVVAASSVDWVDLHVPRPFANGAPVVGFLMQYREISMVEKATWGGDQTYPAVEVEPSSSSSSSSSGSSGGEGSESESSVSSDGDNNSGAITAVKKKAPPKCWMRVEGLWADKTYDFRVAAINDNGHSAWSKASQRGRTKPPLKPERMTEGLRGDEVYSYAVAFSWDKPEFFGAPIEYYKVEQQRVAAAPVDDDDEGEWGERDEEKEKAKDLDLHVMLTTNDSETLRRQLRVEKLVVGSTYKFRIAARNSAGRGAWSPWTRDIQVTPECVGDPLGKWG